MASVDAAAVKGVGVGIDGVVVATGAAVGGSVGVDGAGVDGDTVIVAVEARIEGLV